jgi:hypothetical protein
MDRGDSGEDNIDIETSAPIWSPSSMDPSLNLLKNQNLKVLKN